MKKRVQKEKDKATQDQGIQKRNDNLSNPSQGREENQLLNDMQIDIINKNSTLAANKNVIQLLLSQKAKEFIYGSSYMKKCNRKYYEKGNYYGKKKQKEAKEKGLPVKSQPSPFKAKYGQSMIYDLIKIIDSENLNTESVKTIYDYLINNHPDKVSKEEIDSKENTTDKIKQRVWREKKRRQNEPERRQKRKADKKVKKEEQMRVGKEQQNLVEEEQKQKSQEEMKLDANPSESRASLTQSMFSDLQQSNAEGQVVEQKPKVKPNMFKLATRFSIQQLKSKEIRNHVVPNKRQKLNEVPNTGSPNSEDLTQHLIEELVEIQHIIPDVQKKESAEFGALISGGELRDTNEKIDVQMEEPQVESLQEKINSQINESVSVPIAQQCSQTIILQDQHQSANDNEQNQEVEKIKSKSNNCNPNQNHELDGVESIEDSESEVMFIKEVTPNKPKNSKSTSIPPLRKSLLRLSDKFQNPNPNAKLPKVNSTLNSLKPKVQIQRSDTTTRIRGTNSLQQSIMNQKAKEASRSVSVDTKDDKKNVSANEIITRRICAERSNFISKEQKRLEEEKRFIEQDKKHILKFHTYQQQIYKYVLRLIPLHDKNSKSTPRKSQAQLCNKNLYFLSQQKKQYITRESMDNLLDTMMNLEKTPIKKWTKGFKKSFQDFIDLYNLNNDSIFMEIQSGSGIHCIQATLRANCFSYGVEDSVSALLGSYWLRGETKKLMDKQHELSLYQTQFIREDYIHLDMLAVGDFNPVPASHILIANVESERARFNKLIEVLQNSSFRVLVWPINEGETLKYFSKSQNQIFFVKKIDIFLEPDTQAQLFLYVRSLPENFEEKWPKYIEQQTITLKCDSKKTMRQMDLIKASKLYIAIFKEPVTPEKLPPKSRWIRWNIEEFNKFKEEEKKLKSQTQKRNLQKASEILKNDCYASIKQEINEIFPSFSLRKLLSDGDQSVVFQIIDFSTANHYAIKVSQKNYSEKLVEEWNSIQYLKKKCKGDFFVNADFQLSHEIKLHRKEVLKGYNPSRMMIVFTLYPLTLSDFLESELSRDIDVIQHLFTGIVYGVSEMHSVKYAHCDLKPSNIFIDSKMKPIIGDFGYVRPALTTEFQFLGTLRYMPIEFFTSALSTMTTEYDYRMADVWSLGVLLFQMIYKVMPFKFNLENKNYPFNLQTKEVEQIFVREFLPISGPVNLEFSKEKLQQAIDLIQMMLNRNYSERASIDIVLGHPFCSEIPLPKYQDSQWTFKNDQNFQAEFAQLNYGVRQEQMDIS